MNWLALSCASAIVALVGSCATAERHDAKSGGNTKTIALDQIWAYDMPGTHDIRELEPDKFGERTRSLPSADKFKLLNESMMDQIRAALKRDRPPKDGKAQSGFAVIGTGREALEGAYEVLAKNKKPDVSFPPDSNVTLVFYSHSSGQYVHLNLVEKFGNRFEVGYQFVPHMTRDMTWHLALIPVGKLPIGKYQVEISQLASAKDKTGRLGGSSASDAQRIVCGSFSFSIVDRKDEQ